MDTDRNNILDLKEFVEGMRKIFSGEFESLINFIFNLYDFDKDGKISKEDIRIVLSYVPLEVDNVYDNFKRINKSEFKDRVESQEELHALLEKVFKNNDHLDINKFIYAIENVSSDILLFILIFLMKKKPFSSRLIEEFAQKNNGGDIPKSPSYSKKLIASPNLDSKFSSSKIILKSPSFKERKIENITSKTSNRLGFDLPGNENLQNSKNLLLKFAQPKANINNDNISINTVTLKYGDCKDGNKKIFFYLFFLFRERKH